MSYDFYKIKCVHCLRTVEPSEVLYNTDGGYYTRSEVLKKHPDAEPVYVRPRLPAGFGDDSSEMDDYMERNIITSDVPLITGFRIKGGNDITERYCPHCMKTEKKASKLLRDSGMLPVFTITMVGHSTAGKTVMLLMQEFALRAQAIKFEVGRCALTFSDERSHLLNDNDDEIYSGTKKLKEFRRLVGSTNKIPNPHCLKIRHSVMQGDTRDTVTGDCIVCFRDAIGDSFTTEHLDEKKEKIMEYCVRADGLYVLTDPTALPQYYDKHEDGKARLEDLKLLVQTLREVFDEMKKQGENDKPLVNIMSKADLVMERMEKLIGKKAELNGKDRVIERNMKFFLTDNDKKKKGSDEVAIENLDGNLGENWRENIAGDPEKITDDQTKQTLSEQTLTMLTVLDNATAWTRALRADFSNSIYLPVSSIGDKLVICDVDDFLGKETFRKERKADLPREAGTEAAPEEPDPRAAEEADQLKKRIMLKAHYEELSEMAKKDRWKRLYELEKTADPLKEIKPYGMQLPLLYMLMKFGFMPDLCSESYYKKGREAIRTERDAHDGSFWDRLRSLLAGIIGGNAGTTEVERYNDEAIDKWVRAFRPEDSDGKISFDIKQLLSEDTGETVTAAAGDSVDSNTVPSASSAAPPETARNESADSNAGKTPDISLGFLEELFNNEKI